MLLHANNIKEIVNIKKWQLIQDSMAAVTGMAIVMIDYKGVPISVHSGRKAYCDCIRNDPETSKYCEKCDARAGIEAARLGKAYTYLCHSGIIDAAIPLIVGGEYLGAVMVGQVFLSDQNVSSIERIMDSNLESRVKSEPRLLRAYSALPSYNMEKIQECVSLIEQTSKQIIEEAVARVLLLEAIRPLLKKGSSTLKTLDSNKQILGAINKKTILLDRPQVSENRKFNSMIQLALDYIEDNIGEKILLSDVAEICHTSRSYLSRLFRKETGESFSDHILRKKIEKALEVLSSTDETVNEISNALGFGDCGYFIRQFKKIVGLTPAVYRKTKYTKPFENDLLFVSKS